MGAVCSNTGTKPEPQERVRTFPVSVHVYSLGTSVEVQLANKVLKLLGTGAYHTGVEIHGREWSYAASGLFWCRPRCCEHHTFIETVHMGETRLTEFEVIQLLKMLVVEWPGDSYDLLTSNCCHFVDRLCRCLGVGPIPQRFLNLAGTGAALVDAEDFMEDLVHDSLGPWSRETLHCNSALCCSTCTSASNRRRAKAEEMKF